MLGISRNVDAGFDDAVKRVREALQKEGFGVLTEIDVKETFKEKLDVDFRKYLILGACNPPFAHRALTTDLEIGLLLPLPVTVGLIPERATVVVVHSHRTVAVVAGDRAASAVDRDLVMVDPQAVALGIPVGEQPPLEHLVRGEADARYDVRWVEG